MQDSPAQKSPSDEPSSTRRPAFRLLLIIAVLCAAAAALALVLWWPADPLVQQPAAPVAQELATQSESIPASATGGSAASASLTPTLPVILTPQAGQRSAGDPYAPELGNSGYDVQHYTLQLALDPAQIHVEGTVAISALSTLAGLAELSLDFAGFEVSTVTVDGRAAAYTRADKKLIVTLPTPLAAGQPFDVVVAYRGRPLFEPSAYLLFVDHLGLHFPDGETIFAVAEPDGARYWFPANDHPRDKATFRFEIAVPAGLTAVANGQLLETRTAVLPDGQSAELFVWEHNHLMAPYLATVAVGRYQRLDDSTPAGVPLRHYFFPETQAAVEAATSDIGPALDWFSELLGPYPFEAFGFVTVALPGASLETQTMVLLSDQMIGQRTAVHELVHMWFGNWVSLDTWGQMWRNEGFATYLTLLWFTRDDPEALELEILGVEGVVGGNNRDYALDNPPPAYLFEFNVYYKGALAVHALRQEMGDQAFFAGLRAYLSRYGGGTASDAEFRAVMEEAAGRSLESYFATWFPASGVSGQ